jgi:hypothetical protein
MDSDNKRNSNENINKNNNEDQLEIINEDHTNSDDTEQDEEEFELDTIDEEKLLNLINYNNDDFVDDDHLEEMNRDEQPEQENTEEDNIEINELRSDIDAVAKEIDLESAKNPAEIIMKKYNVNPDIVQKIETLYEYKTIYILDDSTSMNNILQDSPLNTPDNKVRRWDELLYFSGVSIEIANMFNQNKSTDIYFLNREPILNVTDVGEFVDKLKLIKPRGYTPLNRTLETCIDNNADVIRHRKLLIKIITDGEPTNDVGQAAVETFYNTLKNKNHDKIFITMVACTDDKNSISYMSEWDQNVKNLDIVDDYRTVKQQIMKSKGAKYQFSYGDYVVKTFVGSFDNEMDEIDSKKSLFQLVYKRFKNNKFIKLKV